MVDLYDLRSEHLVRPLQEVGQVSVVPEACWIGCYMILLDRGTQSDSIVEESIESSKGFAKSTIQ